MPFLDDLGFRVPVFCIILLFPAIFFVLRRKWRISVARKEEINRLLVFACEEDARAEIEASFGFSSSSIPAQRRVCAVCFAPTTNRCARCKSVHYCSGKCQIIHWRQGHKDECRPSVNSPDINDEEVSFVGDTVEQFLFDGEIPTNESSRIQYGHVKIAPVKPELNPSVELDAHVEVHGNSDASQSCASSSSDGTCIDDSISDIDTLHDLNTDSCDSSFMLDNLEFASSNRNEEQIRPLEEPYSRVPFNGNNMYVPGEPKEKASSRTSSSESNVIHSDKNLSNPSVATSGFWDGSLDYCRSKKYKQNTDAKPDVGESDNLLSDTHSQGLEASSHTHPGISNTGKLIAEFTSTEKDPREPARHQSSTILVSKEGNTKVKVINNGRDLVKSEIGATGEAVLSPMSKKVSWSPKVANGPTSDMKELSAPAINSVKSGSNGAIPSQIVQQIPSTAIGLKTSVLKVVEQFRVPRLSKESDDVGRNTEKAVFPYDLFVKLYHWKVELRPCGLINCGNSCYANAILQCLAFTPPLTAYLLQGLHSKSCAKKDWCFTCEFERLILKAKEGGSALSPIGILSQIQKIGSHLSNGRQEDAHEFLRYAIDTMQTVCLQDAGVNALGSLHEETTLMGLTFGGYLRSKIKCTRCRGKSEKQERMMDLTVEIGGDIETLEEALRKFTGTEPLDGENKYHCGRCKSYEKAKKKLTILEAPNILTVALKRFQSGKFGKLNKTIRFPEILNLAPYMRGGSDKSPVYRLFGVVVHLDIMNAAFSGHYVCYVRNSQNKWYKIDDSMVKAVDSESVLSKGAYMLFYSRISPRAPRSIRSAIVCRDLPSKAKIPEVDHSQRHSRNTAGSRHRDQSSHINRAPDNNFANLSYVHPSGTSFPPVRNIFDVDSSSDNSSLFSHSDEVSSSTTDSNRDSISADDISEYIFGYNAFLRNSSDSDTSSSSSSSSPEYTKHSPLSSSERYSSAMPDDSAHGAFIAEESGSVGRVPFLHSNISSKQVRKIVNISSRSSRGADTERLELANPLENGKSGVHLRRSWTRKSD